MKTLKRYSIEFENPSIHDFVNHYLMKNPELINDLVDFVFFSNRTFCCGIYSNPSKHNIN